MVDYALRHLGISLDTCHAINLNVIGKVLQSYGINCTVRMSKIMYGWIPVGHNWQKCKLKSNKCPCYGNPDETSEHLLGCNNDKMAQAHREAYTSVQNECTHFEVPLHFTATLPKVIKGTLLRGSSPTYHHRASWCHPSRGHVRRLWWW